MVFAQSGNLFPQIYSDGKTTIPSGFVFFEASSQSNSWYIRTLTNAPSGEHDPSNGNGWMIGKSFQDYWSITADKKLIITTPLNGDPKGNVIIIAKLWHLKIEMIQKLGLLYLVAGEYPDVPQNINWIDNSHFQAQTAEHGLMEGKIVGSINQFPEGVEYTFSKFPTVTFGVAYTYSSQRVFPPSSIDGYKIANGKKIELYKILMPTIETGESSSDFNGFSPIDFLSEQQLAEAVKEVRNGEKITYTKPDGKTVEAIPTVPNYNSLATSEPISGKKNTTIRIIFFSLVGVSFLIFIYFGIQKTKHKRKENK